MIVSEGAEHLLRDFDIAELANSPDIIYLLSPALELLGYNAAYIAFARQNNCGGDEQPFPLGRCVTDGMTEPVAQRYRERYLAVLETNTPFAHTYECSSPTRYRRYRQVAYPIARCRAILVTNSLVEETPFTEASSAFSNSYLNEGGVVLECCYCRRLENQLTGRWDWVPAQIATPLAETSHGICPYCLEHYHPAPASTRA